MLNSLQAFKIIDSISDGCAQLLSANNHLVLFRFASGPLYEPQAWYGKDYYLLCDLEADMQ
jgi:hypothetical protein